MSLTLRNGYSSVFRPCCYFGNPAPEPMSATSPNAATRQPLGLLAGSPKASRNRAGRMARALARAESARRLISAARSNSPTIRRCSSKGGRGMGRDRRNDAVIAGYRAPDTALVVAAINPRDRTKWNRYLANIASFGLRTEKPVLQISPSNSGGTMATAFRFGRVMDTKTSFEFMTCLALLGAECP